MMEGARTSFEVTHGVRLVRKDRCWQMRLVGWVLGLARTMGAKVPTRDEWMHYYWSTFPSWGLWGEVLVGYPVTVSHPMEGANLPVLWHEMGHVDQIRTHGAWYVVTRYATDRGRFDIEAPLMLNDIRNGTMTPTQAARRLRDRYEIDTSPTVDEMVAWFEARL